MKKIGIGLAIAVLLIFSFPARVNAGPIINPDLFKLKLLPGLFTTPTPTLTPTPTPTPSLEPTPVPAPTTNIWQLATIGLGAAVLGGALVLLVGRKKEKKEEKEEKPEEEE
ncbi:hypothetical protein COU95_00090 [Candidatus Shapirobacteria bacterium CG10_big_fil_rev_8_21_14_0_10_40_9]|uniref:Uncharacterized protein n=1 Tax=Candidatus Shapirobacteria bacterium CG10_big_fil_rev_8_21_14_0_10_40_9 TaxID=1974888 RepID=A0A2M8L4I9_9BACT|nr:MAG: hypothetical protein COU95_00090 [Candidatus Shapirobacteria bacterium CG10_big_fil_rev_8_21_14_0_10_40_9]